MLASSYLKVYFYLITHNINVQETGTVYAAHTIYPMTVLKTTKGTNYLILRTANIRITCNKFCQH